MRHAWRRLLRGILLIVPTLWFVSTLGQNAARSAPNEQKAVVELKVVKYNGLQEAVKAQRGKVVVVDVWGEF